MTSTTDKNLVTEARQEWLGQGNNAYEAGNAALAQIKMEVARRFAENTSALEFIFKDELGGKKLDGKAIAAMADDWVEKGTLNVGSETYNRSDLSDKLSTVIKDNLDSDIGPDGKIDAALQPTLRSMLGLKDNADVSSVKSVLDQTLPGQKEFVGIAGEAAKSVEVSFWDKIMSAVVGFFHWIATGFQGGLDGLWDNAYKVGADKVANNFGDGLRRQRAANPLLGALLPDENVERIIDGMRDAAFDAAKGKKAPEITPESIAADLENNPPEKTEFKDFGSLLQNKELMNALVRTQVYNGMEKHKENSNGIVASVLNYFTDKDNPKRLDAISGAVSDAMQNTFDGSKPIDLTQFDTPDKLAAEVKRRVKDNLINNKEVQKEVQTSLGIAGFDFSRLNIFAKKDENGKPPAQVTMAIDEIAETIASKAHDMVLTNDKQVRSSIEQAQKASGSAPATKTAAKTEDKDKAAAPGDPVSQVKRGEMNFPVAEADYNSKTPYGGVDSGSGIQLS